MAAINPYTTLQALKDTLRITEVDTIDDTILSDLITQASRFIDDETGRTFYPRIETHSFDTPNGRALWLDDDLLAVITLTNGDGVAIAPTDYVLQPSSFYPKFAIVLTGMSTVFWTVDTLSNYEQVIDLAAWWGFHQRYTTRAWALGSTLNNGGALNAASLTFTVTSGPAFQVGNIIKIENEIMQVSGIAGHVLTVQMRGDNGSTAAIHADTTAIYIWHPEPDIELACRLIAKNLYHNRFGQNTSGVATVTAAGVVLAPEDIPASAMKILSKYTRAV